MKTCAALCALGLLAAGCASTPPTSMDAPDASAATPTVAVAATAPVAPASAAGTTTTGAVAPPAPPVPAVAVPAPAPATPAGQPAVSPPPLPPPASGKSAHLAVGAQVTASSASTNYPDERPATALVDGDLTTRWSSKYSAPQNVVIQLKQPAAIGKIRLHWETAVATKYALSISSDGKTWEGMYAYLKLDAKPERRIDEVLLRGAQASYVKLDLTERVNPEWGFSLHEIEILGPTP